MSKPNIIFLDYDGVLVNPETCIAVGDVGGIFSYIDPVSAGLVKRLCEEFNCKIVTSSSWRLQYDQYALQGILNASCPKLGSYMYMDEKWRTESFNGVPIDQHGRGKEIKAWIDKYSSEFENFVILDDDSDIEPLMDNFVKCDTYSGFRFNQYIEARKILKGNQNE